MAYVLRDDFGRVIATASDDAPQSGEGWAYEAGPPPAVQGPLPPLDQLAAAKRREIHAEARRRRDALVPTYPDHERETWDQQAREAERYAADAAAAEADPSATVPLLAAIAGQRGLPLADMVAKVQAKALAFAAAGGAVIGAQQGLEDQLDLILGDYGEGTIDEPTARAAIEAIDPADLAHWPVLP